MGGIQFSRESHEVIEASLLSANALGHEYVGTEHILLGLITSAPDLVGGADSARLLRGDIYALVGKPTRGKRSATKRPRPYTDRAKRALELAMTATKEQGVSHVSPAHLLQGIAREGGGIGASVLRSRELVLDGYSALTRVESPAERDLGLFELDDAGETPYYEQLGERIRTLIAEGHLEPGGRLPSVRRMADHLEVAPGTVARAYAGLEREGVLETAGRNGTRVAFPVAGSVADAGTLKAELADLLRPAVVAAFHLGAGKNALFEGLELAVQGVFDAPEPT